LSKTNSSLLPNKQANPIIKRNDNIGTGDADTDQAFHDACFVEKGDLKVITECEDPRCILLGRTGSGKTALINEIRNTEENTIIFSPDILSLKHISNSNIINFFEDLGVHLDLFYMFLWMHVITVELLKYKYDIESKRSKSDVLTRALAYSKKKKSKLRAIKYVERYGDEFWQETEERVREFTEQLETQLKGALGAEFSGVSAEAGALQKLSKNERVEVINRAKKVVNDVQLKELNSLIDLLAEDVFHDTQQKYFVLIDNLDGDWADDKIRYRLIKSLIEAIRKFVPIRPLKIVVALRFDLLQKTISNTKNTGFQEEKYEPLYLHLSWSKSQLEDLLNSRLSHLYKRKYTKAPVTLYQLMPGNQINKSTPVDYILERTFYRPREAIQFINECLVKSEGQLKITLQKVREAETTYSIKRLRSLCDEWRSNYPNLREYVRLFERMPEHFQISETDKKSIEEFVLNSLSDGGRTQGPIYAYSSKFFEGKMSLDSLILEILRCLYITGLIGVKTEPNMPTHWAYSESTTVSSAQVSFESSFYIHPTFWNAMGVRLK